ncbi:MAG: hypothetical protein AB7O66_00080 [Limisphaerales bacterium]
MKTATRRSFLKSGLGVAGAMATSGAGHRLWAQIPGVRPETDPDVAVLNPRGRVPLSFIIDDSTCLVNLNKFAMPQFDAAFQGANAVYRRNWKEWSDEIPDAFVRKFGEWCASRGVKGKYSIVPYPACVGRLDRELPGWSAKELAASLDLVRTVMMPNWDIHPEMVTHTRVIDTRTGHPYPDRSLKFMENWDWTTGRSADEIGDYLAYALRILREVGLPCEGVTTPGGFGSRALPQLAQASMQSLRDVFKVEVPHYFRHLYDRGTESVAPRVEYAGGLEGDDPRCVVSIVACTGDWTGGWDNTEPEGADRFITADGTSGRLVDVIERGEPACLLAHWTGIWFNGEERGFRIFQEVVDRLHRRFDNVLWMKLAEIARYWAARELTRIRREGGTVRFQAPFGAPDFTAATPSPAGIEPKISVGGAPVGMREVSRRLDLRSGTWVREGDRVVVCFDLPKGESTLVVGGG